MKRFVVNLLAASLGLYRSSGARELQLRTGRWEEIAGTSTVGETLTTEMMNAFEFRNSISFDHLSTLIAI